MKNLIVISGIVVLILNGVSFLIFESFDSDSLIASEISIGLSVFLLYMVSNSSIDDAFKIALTFGFIFSALVKYVLALYFSMPLTNNYIFLALVILSAIEIISFMSIKYFTRHA